MGGFFSSCIYEELKTYNDYDATVRVEISTKKADGSLIRAFNEDVVNDMHILVYNNNGKLTGNAYGLTNPLVVKAISGVGCYVYAFTNTGDESLFSGSSVSERSTLLNMTTNSIASVDDIKSGDNIEMGGGVTTDIASGQNDITDGFYVSRLAAKNTLIVTCASGITLTGYSIKSLPVKSWLIARPNISEALENDVAIGDDAVSVANNSDWFDTGTISMSGSSPYNIEFYMYENRRGGRVEIGGTTGDPATETTAQKSANKAYYAPQRATYVELYVTMGGTSEKYKLYLGADNSGNYNIKRNCSYTYNISIGALGIMTVDNVIISGWSEIIGGSEEI